MTEGKHSRLAYKTQEETTDDDVREVLAELQNPTIQYANHRSKARSLLAAVKAEINPHVTVTKARYSRGVGTVFITKFEGTCI